MSKGEEKGEEGRRGERRGGEEELGGAEGRDQGLERPLVSVSDGSRNPELGRKQEKEKQEQCRFWPSWHPR